MDAFAAEQALGGRSYEQVDELVNHHGDNSTTLIGVCLRLLQLLGLYYLKTVARGVVAIRVITTQGIRKSHLMYTHYLCQHAQMLKAQKQERVYMNNLSSSERREKFNESHHADLCISKSNGSSQ